MRKADVYCNELLADTLTEESRTSYLFRYDDKYFYDTNCPPISLTLPKSQQKYNSEYLFPFFYIMLNEGVNKKLQSIQL